MEITRDICMDVLRDFETAIEGVANRHNLHLGRFRASYNKEELRIPVKFLAIEHDEDGRKLSPEEANFRKLAPGYGLEPDDYGELLYIKGQTYKITGINPRARKYPIIAKTQDGVTWKLPVSSVTRALNGVR